MTYNVGDIVFYASNDSREERIPCPVCFGKLQVIVILGNGTEVLVDCGYCGKGYEGPKGYVTKYVREPRVDQT